MNIALLSSVVFLLFSQGTSEPRPDPKALGMIKRLNDRIGQAKSAAGTVEVRMLGRTETFDFRFARPNLARFSSTESLFIQDGAKLYWYLKPEKEYTEQTAPRTGLPGGTAFNLGGLTGLEALAFPNEPAMVPVRAASESWNGKDCVAILLASNQSADLKVTLYVDRKTGLPQGWRYVFGEYVSTGIFHRIELNVATKASDFAWQAPPGAKLFKTGGGGGDGAPN